MSRRRGIVHDNQNQGKATTRFSFVALFCDYVGMLVVDVPELTSPISDVTVSLSLGVMFLVQMLAVSVISLSSSHCDRDTESQRTVVLR